MRQIQGFTNKIAVPSFVRDANWHTVDLSGIVDADAKFVEVEMVFGDITLPPNLYLGLRPTGTNLGDDVWLGQFEFPAYTSLTMRVNALGEVDFKCNQSEGDVDFFVTGEWGGDAVVDFGVDYPQATGWTTGNSGTYREFDLTSLIPVEDRGNVEAVLFYARCVGVQADRHESADARANGCTFDYWSPILAFREARIAKVDGDNLIEVREDAWYTKGVPEDQNSFVHFAGYVRRGNQNDGTGNVYAFSTPVECVSDGVDNDVWTAYDVRPVTSPDVAAIYWWLKTLWANNPADYYAREIGSTDAAEQINRQYQANKILDVDANFEVEHKLKVEDFRGTRVAGWLDFIGRVPITPGIRICIFAQMIRDYLFGPMVRTKLFKESLREHAFGAGLREHTFKAPTRRFAAIQTIPGIRICIFAQMVREYVFDPMVRTKLLKAGLREHTFDAGLREHISKTSTRETEV